MQPVALKIIKDEHLALGAVVYSLRFLVREALARGSVPEPRLLQAMLDYIVRYPEHWHHPKEDRYLFARLVARVPEARAVVAGLEREHREGTVLIADLQARLRALAGGRQSALEAFAAAVERYAEFQWEHMRREEDVVFPLAEAHLSDDDWTAIAVAFRENEDPLVGVGPGEDAHRLYRRILSLAPAPIGPVP